MSERFTRPPRSIDDIGPKNDDAGNASADVILEMGSEVEVVATPKRGRGRPRSNKSAASQASTDDDDEEFIPKSKKESRKRSASNLGNLVKHNRKYSKHHDLLDGDDSYEKEKKGRRGRRKKSSNEKKQRPPRDREYNSKTVKNFCPTVDTIDKTERIISSDEDSVVIMDDLPPPVTIPSTPPHGSPLSSDCEVNVPRRLEDSSSGGSGSSSSSSDSESGDSDTSIGSRLTDKSDRSNANPSPVQNNGYDHRSPSPLGGWCQQTSSASDDDDYIANNKNGAGPSGTPPRSPSSASSESPDKSFQCHTCRKWFSSTVTLRIHKRTHLQKPGGGSSGGRSSRRYECDCCDATFTRRERLEQHRSERHRSSLTVRCEVCGRGFEDEERQKRHSASHTADERAGKCSECGKMTGGFSQLMAHRQVHASPAQHTCHLCRKAFTYVHSLSRHLMNHTKAVYKCVVCKTSFDDADALAQHLNSHLDRYKQLKT